MTGRDYIDMTGFYFFSESVFICEQHFLPPLYLWEMRPYIHATDTSALSGFENGVTGNIQPGLEMFELTQ